MQRPSRILSGIHAVSSSGFHCEIQVVIQAEFGKIAWVLLCLN